MDKKSIQKSKEALRRYKKARLAARQRSSSDSSSSSSDSDSSYSSDSDRRNDRRRKKKVAARSSSTSGEERRKREKREHCQKKLEAKRNHLKRKLKEAKLKKRAAVAAAVLSGHSHRSLSPNTQAKLKKLAERKHLRAQSKERREREREKQRTAARDRERERGHGHQEAKRQKTPPRVHQMLTREKIIIQARTRSQTPSAERERMRHEQKMRHDDIARERERRERERERAERDAARDKERAEALARCQERQRERERIAREKLRREEEEKKYAGERGERILPRPSDRDVGPRSYNSRERSMDSERGRHGMPKREIDPAYEREREREYMDVERHGMHDREDMRRERDREFMGGRRRALTPGADLYAPRVRDPRDLYEEERPYGRPYIDEPRPARDREPGWLPRDLHDRNIREPRDFRGVEHDMRFAEEREREHLMRERTLAGRGDWKTNWADSPTRGGERKWEDGAAVSHPARSGFVGGPKRPAPSTSTNPIPNREQRANSEPDWDAGESAEATNKVDNKREAVAPQRDPWVEHDHREPNREKPPLTVGRPGEHLERRWPGDWRDNDEPGLGPIHHRSDRGGRGGFRRGLDHSFRVGPRPLMNLPVTAPGLYGGTPRFPNKRNMTYTNPNIIKKQQALAAAQAAATTAVAAAKAAAQSSANSTTNPSILGQVSSKQNDEDDNEKPEAGEILPEHEEAEAAEAAAAAAAAAAAVAAAAAEAEATAATETTAAATNDPKNEDDAVKNVTEESKASGELSEISDIEDDILSKEERKIKTELDGIACDADNKTEAEIVPEKTETAGTPDLVERTNDDDEMLDFEEISDGELEEEARHKGVGDALGVDWASLIEETKKQAETAAQPNAEQPTTAKEKWQPHRIILDIGISLRMAGEDYAKRLIADSQRKIEDDITSQSLPSLAEIKTEIKEEPTTPIAEDEDSQATTVPMADTDAENTTNSSEADKKIDIKTEIKTEDELKAETNDSNEEQLTSLACSQVAQRQQLQEERQLFVNACGPNSRALSARQDLKLRRQLCGLPTKEPDLKLPVPPVSENLKSMAIAAFQQRSLEV